MQEGSLRAVELSDHPGRVRPARCPLRARAPRAGASRLHHPPGGPELRGGVVANAVGDAVDQRHLPDEPLRGDATARIVRALPRDRLERGVWARLSRRAADPGDEPVASALAVRGEQGDAGSDGLAVLQELWYAHRAGAGF